MRYKYTDEQKKAIIEEQAILILKEYDPIKYSDAFKRESPDYICEKHSVGVEVTEGLSREIQKKKSLVDRIVGKKDGELTDREKKKIKDEDLTVIPLFGFHMAGYTCHGSKLDLKKALESKLNKLPTYKRMNSNELFIYIYDCHDDDIPPLIDLVKLINGNSKMKFDKVFLCIYTGTYAKIYDISEEVNTFELDSELMNKIDKKISEKYKPEIE